MCCFSRSVPHVSATKIFARHIDETRQLLVYSMTFEIEEPLAMVLPLPVALGAGEDALEFVDLSAYPTFFKDIEAAFPPDYPTPGAQPLSRSAPKATPLLAVHSVGLFEASYVPSPADFHRLDPRFRLPEQVFSQHPEYTDFGFAVFKLAPTKAKMMDRIRNKLERQSAHPMAFHFPSRRPRDLFFPTLHVHDQLIHPRASFDHALYCQPRTEVSESLGWTVSHGPIGDFVDPSKVAGLIEPERKMWRYSAHADLPNRDAYLCPLDLQGPLSVHTDRFQLDLKVSRAHRPYQESGESRLDRWHDTASTRMDEVRDALLAEIETQLDRDDLAPWSDELPAHWMNGPKLWLGSDFLTDNEGPGTPGIPGRLRIPIWTEEVEPQDLWLPFSRLPTDAECAALQRTLQEGLTRRLSQSSS